MISVIIPTYNDEGFIRSTISYLQEKAYTRLLKEIIIVDAGSTDSTMRVAKAAGATLLKSIRKGRAIQMNIGAEYAKGDILYFLTPGTLPPENYCNEIVRASLHGKNMGTFEVKYENNHWLLNTVTWFTNKKGKFTSLDGQSLFVNKNLFHKAGGFNEALSIMEEHELVRRLKRYSDFVILNEKIISSSCKYTEQSIFRKEFSYLTALGLYVIGYPQEKLTKIYNFLVGKAKARRTQQELSPSFSS
jgi:rSAM/selenodomain-associated transferase 2